jgi:hypothetical protein
MIVLPAALTNFKCEIDATSAIFPTENYNLTFAHHKSGNITYERKEAGSIKKGESNNYMVNVLTESESIQLNQEQLQSQIEFWHVLAVVAIAAVPIVVYLLRKKPKQVTLTHEGN